MSKKLYNYHFNKAFWDHLNHDDFLIRIGTLWNTPLADRFNYCNKYSLFDFEHFDDQLPKIDTTLEYYQLCIDRALELIDQCPNGIAISVSGGVDSAGIVCSSLAAGINPEKLLIICNEVIHQEFPGFLDFLIKHRCRIRYMKSMDEYTTIYDNVNEDKLVFGWCSDQLFHHVSNYKNPGVARMPYDMAIEVLYTQKRMEQYIDRDIDIIQGYSKHCNWPIETWYDASVLMNFGLHYDITRHYFQESSLNSITRSKVIQFFDTQQFQNWGYTNREVNKEYFIKCIHGDNSVYKLPLKQIIFDITKDENYFKNKGKEPSWGKMQTIGKQNLPFIVGVRDKQGYHVSHLSPYYMNLPKEKLDYCNEIIYLMLRDYIKDAC